MYFVLLQSDFAQAGPRLREPETSEMGGRQVLPTLLARHAVDFRIPGPAVQLPVPNRVRALPGPGRAQAGATAVHDDAVAGRAAEAVSLRSLSTYALGAGNILGAHVA